MNVLLIDAQAAGRMGRAVVEWIPAGIRAIAGILEHRKIDYEIKSIENLLKDPGVLSEFDMAMLTGMSSDFEQIKKAGAVIRDKNLPFVTGGPVSFDPIRVLKEARADVAVIGEGEVCFDKLLTAGLKDGVIPDLSELQNIEGTAFVEDDRTVRVNRPKGYLSKEELQCFTPSVKAIKSYPFHDEVMVVMEILRGCSNFHKPKVYHGRECISSCKRCESNDLSERLQCPIGAPAGCGFCSVGGLYGPPRSKEQKKIINELEGLIDEGATKIAILDPDPLDYKREELVTPDPLTDPELPMPNYPELERLGDMIWAVPEIAAEDAVVTVRDVKATLVTHHSVKLLKKYFPRSVFGIGCETGSREHSKRLGRPYEPEKVLEAAKIFYSHGIKPKINMIVGLPYQNEVTITETLQLMDELEPFISHFDFTRFESLPMSGFDDHPSDTGPLKDENTRRLLESSNRLQKRFFEKFIGERLKVVIGVYDGDKEAQREDGEKTPRRGFRSLAGLVGYPIFDKRQMSLYATIIRIRKGDQSLKTGDVAHVKVDGVSLLGFRFVLDGTLD